MYGQWRHGELVRINKVFNKIAIQATAQMAADKEASRESTCVNLSVSCPHEIIVYSVLKHY